MNSEYLRKIKLFANEGSLQSGRHKIAAEHSLYRFDVHFFFVFNKNPVSTHSTVGLAAVAPGTAASNSMRLKMKNTFLLCLNHIQKLLNLLLMMKFTCRHPLTVQSKLVANIQIRIFGFNVRIEIPLFFFVCRNFSGHLAATQAHLVDKVGRPPESVATRPPKPLHSLHRAHTSIAEWSQKAPLIQSFAVLNKPNPTRHFHSVGGFTHVLFDRRRRHHYNSMHPMTVQIQAKGEKWK